MYDERAIVITFDDLEQIQPTPSLNLPDITEEACYKHKGGEPYRVFTCIPTKRYTGACPVCRKYRVSIHGNLPQRRVVHDVNLGVEQIDLLVKVPRYRCENCGHTFTHRFESIVDKRQMTYRLYDQIRRDSFVRPFSDVAADFGYTAPTIAAIFDEYVSELEARRDKIVAPRILGIDEKHIVHDARGVFVDIEMGRLLEMTASNKKADIINAIESMEDYDTNIQLVTMDMSNGYRAYVRECLPYAKIIVDKYHVFQDMHDKIRKAKSVIVEHLKNQIETISDPEEKLRKKNVLYIVNTNPYLFKFGQEKLAEKDARIEAMADVCMTFPEFNHLRLLKEGFELIYECSDRPEAEMVYEDWAKLVPPSGAKKTVQWEQKYSVSAELFTEFKALQRTINSWYEEVFAYFEPGCNVTNAAAEGLNNMIERFNRMGNGYSFARLRAKALFWHLAAPRKRYVIDCKKKPVYKESTHIMSFVDFSRPASTRQLIGYENTYYIAEQKINDTRQPLPILS